MVADKAMETADELRKLASWYREFAERAGNPAIWASRLRTAEDLDQQAEDIQRRRQLERMQQQRLLL